MKKIYSAIIAVSIMSSFMTGQLQVSAQNDAQARYEEFLKRLNAEIELSPFIPALEQNSNKDSAVKSEPVSDKKNITKKGLDKIGQVKVIGRLYRTKSVHIEVKSMTQLGDLFSGEQIWNENPLVTSHDPNLIPSILKAAGNDLENKVEIVGKGVDNDADGKVDAISLDLTEGASIRNIKDPGNPLFEKVKKAKQRINEREEKTYYGEFRVHKNGRAYVWMTNKNGDPIDWDGNIISDANDANNSRIRQVRIAYNEKGMTNKIDKKPIWEVVYDYGRSFNAEDNELILVQFIGFLGNEKTGAKYAHISSFGIIREVASQLD